MTGEKWDRKGGGTEAFNLFSSLFADDCAVLFNTREDMITGANYLYHLQKVGLLMHIDRQGQHLIQNRSHILPRAHAATAPRRHRQLRRSRWVRFFHARVHSSLKSDVDVNTRITKATAAFGALHYCFFSNQRVSLKDKGRVYAVLVLTILLHGSKCWSTRRPVRSPTSLP